jgi:hypothetical protein
MFFGLLHYWLIDTETLQMLVRYMMASEPKSTKVHCMRGERCRWTEAADQALAEANVEQVEALLGLWERAKRWLGCRKGDTGRGTQEGGRKALFKCSMTTDYGEC